MNANDSEFSLAVIYADQWCVFDDANNIMTTKRIALTYNVRRETEKCHIFKQHTQCTVFLLASMSKNKFGQTLRTAQVDCMISIC